SVGLNGVGAKAVNALSDYVIVQAVRDNQTKIARFEKGQLVEEEEVKETTLRKGTKITFKPDNTVFKNYRFVNQHIEKMLWNYAYLNPGLTIMYNGEKFYSENGLKDLLDD